MQVFAKAGLDSPVLGSIIVGAVNVMGTTAAVFLMDNAGRRQLLLVSHAIMAACLAALSISSWLPCGSATSTSLLGCQVFKRNMGMDRNILTVLSYTGIAADVQDVAGTFTGCRLCRCLVFDPFIVLLQSCVS